MDSSAGKHVEPVDMLLIRWATETARFQEDRNFVGALKWRITSGRNHVQGTLCF